MDKVDDVEVVVAHSERATLRVGTVFLKVDSDQGRSEDEVESMRLAPVPTPEVLWHQPPVLALAAVPGTPLARLGRGSTAPPAAWASAGAVVRALHEAPPPPWPAHRRERADVALDAECMWLVENDVLPRELVRRNREIAGAALRPPAAPVFVHGDLQCDHVFVDGDLVTGVLDWSEAGQGDGMHDLATLTLGYPEHLDQVLSGYGAGADRTTIRAHWSLRCLMAIRWLVQHGFDPFRPGCEVDVLRRQMDDPAG
jgi:aminoglycoside phosphotransferase